jgi:pyruvate dehydrogenase E2 component (dihydrolipoamide acetyltransferase)
MAAKARDGKLAPEDMTGSSFSVTNMGSAGSLLSFPIINVPDAAILGVQALQERPVVRDGQIVVRHMMYLSLSFDHRLVDGAEAARFVKHIARLLESPDQLLLEAI